VTNLAPIELPETRISVVPSMKVGAVGAFPPLSEIEAVPICGSGKKCTP